MAKTDFIPELWAAQFLRAYEEETVLDRLVSRTYQADLQGPGDRIEIQQHTLTPTVSDYTVDTDITGPQAATGGTPVVLELNKQKYWHVYVDDIDRVQSAPDIMQESVRKGAKAMREQIEDDLFAVFNTATKAANKVSDTASASGITDGHTAKLIELAMKMDEANVPAGGRWLMVNPLFTARLRKYITSNDTHSFTPEVNQAMLRRGVLGELLGFTLIASNRIPVRTGAAATSEVDLYAGVGEEVEFAMQITEMTAYEPELRFGDAVKALNVYGAKEVRDLYALRIKGNAI